MPHDQPHDHEHASPPPRRLTRLTGERVLFFDTPSGASGDMLVGALIDLGVSVDLLQDALQHLPLRGYTIQTSTVTRSHIKATRFAVVETETQPSRDYKAIVAMLHDATGLSSGARKRSLCAFEILARSEAQVHGVPVDAVHFHEVGAVDSIIDIVSASVALDHLDARVFCSPLPMGRGFTRSQHGVIPLPAPATLLCLEGVPTYDAGVDGELVTPTGACLLKANTEAFTRWPAIKPLRVGWGAGTREWPDRPNLLRAVLGEAAAELSIREHTHVVIEANVDDMSPEIAAICLERAFTAGALDAWSVAIGMKKGRPAFTLCALAQREHRDAVTRALLNESTSLGVRISNVSRIERPRRIVEVSTPFGPIAVKVADGDGLAANIAPELGACRAAAESHGVPTKHVYAAALASWLEMSASNT